MIGGDKLARLFAGLLVGFGAVVGLGVSAEALELPLESVAVSVPGGVADGTLAPRVELGLAGTSSINTIILSDTGAGSFDSAGGFSSHDLDAFVLSRDSHVEPTGGQLVLAGLTFDLIGGKTRLAGNAPQLASTPVSMGNRLAATSVGSIGSGTAPLDTFDAKKAASVARSDGFLSLGDGGKHALNFADILIGGGLYLIFGDVVGPNETPSLGITAKVPLPGSVWLFISALAILFYMSSQRDSLRS